MLDVKCSINYAWHLLNVIYGAKENVQTKKLFHVIEKFLNVTEIENEKKIYCGDWID